MTLKELSKIPRNIGVVIAFQAAGKSKREAEEKVLSILKERLEGVELEGKELPIRIVGVVDFYHDPFATAPLEEE